MSIGRSCRAIIAAIVLASVAWAAGASLSLVIVPGRPATDFRAYNANGTALDWTSTANECRIGRFTIDIPAGNWAVFIDEDGMPPTVTLGTNGAFRWAVTNGVNWNRVSPVFTGPGVFTVNLAILETSPWFFRLQKL